MRQLLDVVHQAIQLPLCIDFDSSSQRESVELLVVPQIAEYRLHRGKAPAIPDASLRTIDTCFHFVGIAHAIPLALKERHLSHLGLVRLEQAAITMLARHTVALRALEFHRRITIDRAATSVAVKLLARRANTCACLRVVIEILWPVARGLFGSSALVVNRIGQCLVFTLIGKAFIAAAHVGIGYQRFDFQFRQLLEVVI